VLRAVGEDCGQVEEFRRVGVLVFVGPYPQRYRALRRLMFQSLGGRLLDTGVGTGRNCPFYPPDAIVSGIDASPAMLARAHRRCPTLSAARRLYVMDVTKLQFSGRLVRCRGRDVSVLRAAR
jgi:ubiquinone/menaquinone biosynthesis C-methylase UbiE